MRVTLRNGGAEAWVLAHIEVQGDPETIFAERMYVYNYRTACLTGMVNEWPAWPS